MIGEKIAEIPTNIVTKVQLYMLSSTVGDLIEEKKYKPVKSADVVSADRRRGNWVALKQMWELFAMWVR
jgi:hypothetical protein